MTFAVFISKIFSPLNKKSTFLFLVALIASVFVITRLYNFEYRFAFDHDQEQSANASWRIIKDKRPMLIGQQTSQGALFVGPALWWFQSLALLIADLNPLALGYLAIFVSLLGLIFIFLTTYQIASIWQALLAAFLYAVSFRITSYDILGSAISYLTLFSILIFYFNVKIFIYKKYYLLPVLSLILSLTFHVHLALVLLIPLSAALLFWRRAKIKRANLLISLLIFAVPFLPMILFELRHNYLLSHNLVSFLDLHSSLSISKILQTSQTLSRLLAESVLLSKFYLLTFAAFTLTFILLAIKRQQKEIMSVVLLTIFLPLLALWLFRGHILEYYFVPTVPIFIILTSCVYYFIARKIPAAFLVIIIAIIISNVRSHTLTLTGSPDLSFANKKAAVDNVIADTRAESFKVYYQMPLGLDGGYRYLFKWRGREPQDFGKNLYILEAANPQDFDPSGYYRTFLDKQIKISRFGFVHVISVK